MLLLIALVAQLRNAAAQGQQIGVGLLELLLQALHLGGEGGFDADLEIEQALRLLRRLGRRKAVGVDFFAQGIDRMAQHDGFFAEPLGGVGQLLGGGLGPLQGATGL